MASLREEMHHSVVLDLMAVESYRVEQAGAKSRRAPPRNRRRRKRRQF